MKLNNVSHNSRRITKPSKVTFAVLTFFELLKKVAEIEKGKYLLDMQNVKTLRKLQKVVALKKKVRTAHSDTIPVGDSNCVIVSIRMLTIKLAFIVFT